MKSRLQTALFVAALMAAEAPPVEPRRSERDKLPRKFTDARIAAAEAKRQRKLQRNRQLRNKGG